MVCAINHLNATPKFGKCVLCHNLVARLPKQARALSGGGRQDERRKNHLEPGPEKIRDCKKQTEKKHPDPTARKTSK